MRPVLLALIVAVLGLGPGTTGCARFRPIKGPTVPHPGQRVWVNETAVINLVTRYVYEAHFDQRRPLVEARYATLIRYWYTQTSDAGQDLDGGQRAVSFIHKIHLDAGGNRELWTTVLGLARESAPGEDTMPVPATIE